MGECPDDGQWQRWLDGELAAAARDRLIAHLDACASCCAFVAALGGDADGDGLAAPAATVDRYQLLHRLGAGAMGVVHAAHDPRLERQVAIKLLRNGERGAGAADARRRMLREACAMARLSHPNVVAVHDVGVVDDQVFIAMELVDGTDLASWCAAAPRPLAQRLAVMTGVAAGLAAIHAAGLVHRDVKPDNILVDRRGHPRISDLGVATAMGAEVGAGGGAPPTALTRLTVGRALVGTPAYMAPEQLDGAPADARADQFAFCVTLHEVVFGVRPFAGDDVAGLRAAIEAGALTAPRTLEPRARRALAIARRGLAADPARRYPSMDALLADLRPPRRRWRWSLAATIAAALVAAGAFALGRQTGEASALAVDAAAARPALVLLGVRTPAAGVGDRWLGPALADLLIHELTDDHLRLARGDDVARARAEGVLPAAGELPALGLALERARARFGADLFAVGSCVRIGDRVRVAIAVHDAHTRALRWQAFAEGAMSDLPAMVGRLAADLRRPLGVDGGAPRRQGLADPGALEAYSDGVEALRRADYLTAGDRLTEAARRAPDAAAIQLALAEVHHMRGHYQLRQQALARAVALSSGASREQQLAIRAAHALAMGATREAIDLYRSLAAFFPDDPRYGYLWVEAELQVGAPRDGLAAIARLRAQPGRRDDPALDLLEGELRRELGDLDGARAILRVGVEHARRALAASVEVRALVDLGWVDVQRGGLTDALALARAAAVRARETGDLLGLARALELAGRADVYLGGLGGAERELTEMAAVLERLTWRTGYGYNLLARAQLERGALARAAATLALARGMAEDTVNDVGMSDLLQPAIDLALVTGDRDGAERALARLGELDASSSSPLRRARHAGKRAAVRAAAGDHETAAELLAEAVALVEFAPIYQAELRLALATEELARGRARAAAAEAAAAATVFARSRARELEARAQAVVALAAGDRAIGDAAAARAAALAAGSESPLTRVTVDVLLGARRARAGTSQRAAGRAAIRRALADARALGAAGLADRLERLAGR